MSESTFSFVTDKILQQNLDESFDYILILVPFIEYEGYDDSIKSSLRQTIIIFTASIIEALLFHIIDTQLSDADLTTYSWELRNKIQLYEIDNSHTIVAGDYTKIPALTRKNKLNLGKINTLLRDTHIVSNALYKEIDEVRILRNGQHLSTQTEVKEYTKEELEKVFSVASTVKDFVKKKKK